MGSCKIYLYMIAQYLLAMIVPNFFVNIFCRRQFIVETSFTGNSKCIREFVY